MDQGRMDGDFAQPLHTQDVRHFLASHGATTVAQQSVCCGACIGLAGVASGAWSLLCLLLLTGAMTMTFGSLLATVLRHELQQSIQSMYSGTECGTWQLTV